MPILLLSLSNQKLWNFLVKLKLKIPFSSASYLFVNNKLHPFFNRFIFSSTFHNYETSFVAKGHLKIPTVTTATHGKGTVTSMATKTWNNTQRQIKDPMINTFSPNKLSICLLWHIIMDDSFSWHIVMDDISFDCLDWNNCKGFLVVW